MPVGKKLVVAASVLATGAGAALFFRKDASTATSWPSTLDESPFRQRVERRVATDAAWARQSAHVETVSPGFGLPTAEAAAVRPQDELTPTFQKTLNPVGAMLEPIRELPGESVDGDAPPLGGGSMEYSDGLTSMEHRIADGDTLIKLAQKYLGRPERYLEIYDRNRDVLTNPDLLPIGVILKIPPRDATPEWKTSTQDSAWAPAAEMVPVDRHARIKRPAGGE
jgi:nucleoid-associated protein YgaU